jgi:hypothetical protein
MTTSKKGEFHWYRHSLSVVTGVVLFEKMERNLQSI